MLLSWRAMAPREAGHGEYHALLLTAVLGMMVLAGATNLVTVFIGYELLSIPLYVLCATEMRRERSLESGLKYLIIGSVGSATLLYGLAFVYGATGATSFAGIAEGVSGGGMATDVLLLTGLALTVTGLAFKASIAPFHQWTPDVYEGAPTPITAFMAVATKAAAFGIILRFFDTAVIGAVDSWAPALATLAVITIVVGNVGAIGQSSLKRLLAYSSVGQAGYMIAGVVITTQLGVRATVFYLAVYLLMNLAAFAVIVARERESGVGDDISSLYGLGADRPLLAWPMTIAMLALAGFPATAGFFGKVYLIEAAASNGYTWLGVVIVIGSAISLAYYLRVVSAVWMRSPVEAPSVPAVGPGGARPAIAGGSAEADADPESVAATAADRGDAAAAPARGRGARGGVRGGDDLLRDLPEPAARPGGRRRGVVVPAVLSPGVPGSVRPAGPGGPTRASRPRADSGRGRFRPESRPRAVPAAGDVRRRADSRRDSHVEHNSCRQRATRSIAATARPSTAPGDRPALPLPRGDRPAPPAAPRRPPGPPAAPRRPPGPPAAPPRPPGPSRSRATARPSPPRGTPRPLPLPTRPPSTSIFARPLTPRGGENRRGAPYQWRCASAPTPARPPSSTSSSSR